MTTYSIIMIRNLIFSGMSETCANQAFTDVASSEPLNCFRGRWSDLEGSYSTGMENVLTNLFMFEVYLWVMRDRPYAWYAMTFFPNITEEIERFGNMGVFADKYESVRDDLIALGCEPSNLGKTIIEKMKILVSV